MKQIYVDNLIFGGGVAGLWAGAHLRNKGYNNLIVEKSKLGDGQTIASQGTIYGGTKYAVGVAFREDSVEEIKGMPNRWRKHLNGELEPNLSNVEKLSDFKYIWVPKGRKFQAIFAKRGMQILETKPIKLNENEYPDWLRRSAELVYSVDEPIVETKSLLKELAIKSLDRIIYSNTDNMEIGFNGKANVEYVKLDNGLKVYPENVILTAGKGNESLSKKMGIEKKIMQERPLRQVYVKGDIPKMFGHCIDIVSVAKNVIGTSKSFPTIATITTKQDKQSGENIWNVGGKIAEEGVNKEPSVLIKDARTEIKRILGGVDLSNAEIGCFDAVRAEINTGLGERPGGSEIYHEGNVYVCWPTKLALAPSLSDKLESRINKPKIKEEILPPNLINKSIYVADYPWTKKLQE